MNKKKNSAHKALKVMLLKDPTHRLEWVTQSLQDASCQVVHFSGSLMDMEAAILRESPDVIMIDTESPSRDTLEHVCLYCQICPRPVVMFTEDSDSEKLRQAVRAGVAAYVVAGLSSERVRPILEAAIARHEVQSELAQELSEVKATLQDKQLIDQAKRQLIRQGLSEEQAYNALRKLAMDSGTPLAEAARKVMRIQPHADTT
jgi:two-component system, response regulator / RNA-binding antiterminator